MEHLDVNHYDTLGVAHDASADEIKAAYRKLASQHHPDKGGDREQMQRINEAHDVLSSEAKRAQYDEAGAMDPDSIEAKAQNYLDGVFRSAINDPSGDPINHAFQQLAKAPPTLKTRLLLIQQQQTRLRGMLGKTRRIKGRNRIELLIEQRLQALVLEEREAAEALQVAHECIRMLGEYEGLVAAKPKTMVHQFADGLAQAQGRAF